MASAIVAGLWIAVTALVSTDKSRAIETAYTNADTLARAVDEHVADVFNDMHQMLRMLVREHRKSGITSTYDEISEDIAPAGRRFRLTRTNAEGYGVPPAVPMQGGSIFVGDLDHVRFHAEHDSNDPFVGRTIIDPASHAPAVHVSRRLSTQGGSFDGTIGVSIDAAYFSRVFETIGAGRDGVIVLSGTDGIVRALAPARGGGTFGQDLSKSALSVEIERTPVGRFVSADIVDGIPRLYSYRPVTNHPLFVSVGLGMGDVLADWRRRRDQLLAAAALASVIMVAGASFFGRRLQRRERFLRSLIDSLPASISYIDRDHRFRFMNSTGASWHMRAGDEVIGAKVGDVFPPSAAAAETIQLVNDGKPHFSELDITTTDGHARSLRISRIPDVDSSGNIQGYFRLAIDLAEQKAAENALRETRNNLADAIASLDQSVIIYDRDDRVVSYNLSFIRQFPDLAGAIEVGMRFEDLYRIIVDRGQLALPEAMTKERLLADRVAAHIGADGSRNLRTLANGRVIETIEQRTKNGGIVAIGNDVTSHMNAAKLLAEARDNLSDAIEGIHHSILLYDRDDRILLFNRGFVRHFPEVAGSVAVGMRFEEMLRLLVEAGVVAIPPDVGEERFIADRLALHRRADGKPFLRTHRDGRVFQNTESRTSTGGLISIAIDITERVRTEERLRESQKMEAVGQLTGGIAHDFNNHLAVIMGNLELADASARSGASVLPFIELALSGAKHSADLTRSLLAFSRRQPLSPKVVDVSNCILSTVKLIDRALGEDVAVTISLGAPLWPVLIDEAQLSSCLVNLANNARDSMPKGGALTFTARNLTLTADDVEGRDDMVPGEVVLIEVADTGSGMSEEVRSRAFEPFFTTKEVGRGTGLGLSMVHGFVRQSGGYLVLRSKVGQGTSMLIYLPRSKEGTEPQEPQPADEIPVSPRGKTILVVEDNVGVRRTVTMQLRSLGYETVEAESPEAALAILSEADQVVDLLFTDIVMPGPMDGYALAREAVARHPDQKVLLTSGFPDKLDESSRKGSRTYPFLGKPYNTSQLARTIRSALEAG